MYSRFDLPLPLCNVRISLLMMSFSVTIYSFALSAIQRYVTIVHNRGNMLLFKKKWQPLLFTAVWIFSAITVIPTYSVGDIIVLFWRDLCFLANPEADMFLNIMFGFSTFLSLCAIPFLYIRIFMVVRKSSRAAGTTESGSKSKGKAVHMALVLFILYITYTVAFTPCTLFTYVGPFISDLESKRQVYNVYYT